MTPIVLETNLEGLPSPRRGKVRDIYDLGDSLLIVATDRISAFDVVLPNAIPEKGRVLTRISQYWFSKTADIVKNHLLATEVRDFPAVCQPHAAVLEGRSILVRKAAPLPIECVVRGYLTGSGLKEYRATGAVSGVTLPAGLTEASRLPEPIFTPSTKAAVGEHDVHIDFKTVVDLVGKDVGNRVRDLTLAVYRRACQIVEPKGIIIADTKLEFGIFDGEVILIDEVLTPDSSRFWPMNGYTVGVRKRASTSSSSVTISCRSGSTRNRRPRRFPMMWYGRRARSTCEVLALLTAEPVSA